MYMVERYPDGLSLLVYEHNVTMWEGASADILAA